jgi:DNA (cytosine-5)-methyltransferase 1
VKTRRRRHLALVRHDIAQLNRSLVLTDAGLAVTDREYRLWRRTPVRCRGCERLLARCKCQDAWFAERERGVSTTIGSLCSGMGGLDLAVEAVLGPARHAWHAESDPDASKVLATHWPDTPNRGDLTAVDWSQVEPVDVLVAGYPCQGESLAGRRRGAGDERWLWPHVAGAVRVVRPRLVVLENVPGHLSMGFGRVLGDLAACGYDARWQCVRASDVGAPHRRERVFIVAWPADPEGFGHRLTGPQGWRRVPSALVAGGAGPDGVMLLPTPTAERVSSRIDTRLSGDGRTTPNKLGWAVADALPPTPAARDHKGANQRQDDTCLHGALLPTPRASDGTKGGPNQRGSSGDLMLPSAVMELLPTPMAADGGWGRGSSAGFGLRNESRTIAETWGRYAPAIARWEQVVGRPAPDPTEPGSRGQPRLSPRFVEWLMGLPAGWVTDHVGRNAALRILGNGVVWQQGAYALRSLLGAEALGSAA